MAIDANVSLENTAEENAADSPGHPFLGQVLGGRYCITRCLRLWGDAATLLAIDQSDESQMVLQVVAHQRVSVGAQMRLEHETRRLHYIRTPWFQPPRELGQDGPWLYVATPFVVGETLADRNRRGPRPVEETLAVASGLLSALIDIHRVGALHRAVNPQHVVFDASGSSSRVKLTGFGLTAAVMAASAPLELTEAVHYFSPEQTGLLDRDLGPASDLYSLGVVLFECLAGQPPFVEREISELLLKQMTAPVPKLRSLGVEIPRGLDEMIQRLLRKDPRDRYQSAEAVLADVRSLRHALRQGVQEPKVVVGGRDQRRTLTDPAFVGRERELELLDRQLAHAKQGTGSLVFIESESGGGKTQLLSELAQRAAGQGLRVFRGQIRTEGMPDPLSCWTASSDNAFWRPTPNPNSRRHLAHRLAEHRAALTTLWPEIDGQWDTPRRHRPHDDSFGESRSIAALGRLLESLGTAARPAVVLLDDAQWMDELTAKFLIRWYQELARSTGRDRHLVIVIAFRGDELTQDAPLRRMRPPVHLKLAPFDRHDVRRLAESIAGPLPTEAIDLVCRLSQGSPFMASAVLRGLVESKALQREPEGWRVRTARPGGSSVVHVCRRVSLVPTGPAAGASDSATDRRRHPGQGVQSEHRRRTRRAKLGGRDYGPRRSTKSASPVGSTRRLDVRVRARSHSLDVARPSPPQGTSQTPLQGGHPSAE